MKTFTYTFTVPASAIDFNGHVNNITYLEWMMEAAVRHSRSVGMSFERCVELGGTWVARSNHIEYKKPAFEGEELRMETWIESLGRLTSRRQYRIIRTEDEALICSGQTEWVFVDAKRQRPAPIPAPISEAFGFGVD